MFKKLLWSALFLSLPIKAHAADLPSRAPPPAFIAPAAFSWTGAYIGGQVGYAFGDSAVVAPGLFGTVAYRPRGVLGGGHVGYSYDLNHTVIGLEADVDGSGYSGRAANPGSPVAGAVIGTGVPVDGSVRARLGFAADWALFYGTGGVAIALMKDSYLATASSVTLSRARVGYTVGGGVDYAVTNSWVIGVAYRYTDYGKFSELPANPNFPRVHRETDSRVLARFSYKFDSLVPAAVVARY